MNTFEPYMNNFECERKNDEKRPNLRAFVNYGGTGANQAVYPPRWPWRQGKKTETPGI
jgi:hypothetical protein